MRVIGVYQESVLPEGLERVGIGFRTDVPNVLVHGSSPGRESDDTVFGDRPLPKLQVTASVQPSENADDTESCDFGEYGLKQWAVTEFSGYGLLISLIFIRS